MVIGNPSVTTQAIPSPQANTNEQTRAMKQTNKQKSKQCVQQLEDSTASLQNCSSERRKETRQRVIDELQALNAAEEYDDVKEPTIPKIVMERLRTAIEYLNEPTQYNSTLGLSRKRFLYQLLAVPELGDEDPAIRLIAKELHINLPTFKRFANERQEHGLGYIPSAHTHGNTTAQWIQEVPLFLLVLFLFVSFVLLVVSHH